MPTNMAKLAETQRFAQEIGLPLTYALGCLELLRQHGDLSKDTDEEIAVAAEYPKDPKVFVAAMQHCGFLNERRLIYPWEDFHSWLLEVGGVA